MVLLLVVVLSSYPERLVRGTILSLGFIHQQHETSFETTLAALQTRGGTLTARMNNRASPRRWQRRRFGMYTALTY